MSTESSGRWGDLILLWLWGQKGDGPRAALVKALAKAARAVPGEEVAARVDAAIADLLAEKAIERGEGQSKKKAAGPKLALTDAGNQRALRVQGLERLPKKIDFASAQARWISLSATGVPRERLSKQKGFLAGLLRERLGLPVKPGASMNAVRDAIAWRELGVETDRPFTAAAVTAHLLSRRIGAARPLSADKALAVLAAREVGAASPTNEQIKHAAVAGVLSGTLARSGDGPSPAAPVVEEPAPEDGAAFAAKVLAAAEACEEGKYDEHHVFIARLFDHLAARGEAGGMDLDAFKQRLVEANRARLLTLSRADFVEAMSPEDVRRSEVRYHSATFHFVRR